MKKLIYLLFTTVFILTNNGCKKQDIFEEDNINLSIQLNLNIDFSLELDQTTSKSSFSTLKTDSEFNHVIDDELTITFTSDPEGYSNSLTFDPSDSQSTISLPYGNYNWEIESSIVSGTAISQKLPVYGQSSSTVLINQTDVNLDLVVQTDYSLITVNTEHVSSVLLKHDDDSINLDSKDGFFYGYVYSGSTSFTLEVADKEGSTITTTLDSVESCKEYKYTLNYSDVNVNSLVCLCEPFEVIERFLIPSSVCGQWSKILSSEEIPSYFDLDNFNISTQFALNKENLEFYFIDPSGKLVTYSIENNSFIEQNVNFAIGNMRDHIYNPIINKIQYIRAGRETVYELNLNTLESTVSFNGSSDSSHYNGIYFFNSFTNQIGHYGGYGFSRSKNSMADYSSNSSTWELSIEDSSTSPYRRFGGSRRWLLPNHDYSKLIIVGGVGNQSGQQGSSCESPLVTYNNDFCFLSDVWEIDLNNYSLNQISGFDNEGLNSFGINGYDYEKNILVKYIGHEPYNSSNQHVLNEELKYFKINSPEEGWVLVDQTGDVPTIISDDIKGSFFYEERSNKFYLIKSDGVWTLDMNCD